MPRQRRIALINHPHIITARGNANGLLFFDDTDFEAYLEKLRELVRDDLFRVFAFCLMKTELRLIVVPTRVRLAQAIQRLHTAHARRVNKKESRRGHLFEGRFESVIIPREQLANAVRAVHLWPVRIDRVRRAETYPWSSHRAYVRAGDDHADLVDAWSVLEGFGDTLPAAQRAFNTFTESAAVEADGLGVSTVVPGIAGTRAQAESILAEAGVNWKGRRRPAIKTLARRVCLVVDVSLEDLLSRSRIQHLVLARRLLATVAVRSAGRSVTEVAHFLGRDKAQVSRLVQQGMDLARSDEGFRQTMENVRGRG